MSKTSKPDSAHLTHHSSLSLQPFCRNKLDEIADAAGVAPLVVVPGKHLDQSSVDDLRVFGINNRRIRIPFEVARDKRLFGKRQNSAQLLVRRVFQSTVYFFRARLFLNVHDDVHQRDIGRGHSH